MNNNILLQYLVEQEIAKKEYLTSSEDRRILNEMLAEINCITGSDVHYLAELDYYTIKGAGETIKKYILLYESESVKSYLLHLLVRDRIENSDKLIYQMYLKFKSSDEYIALPNQPARADIYVRYDNAFRQLKPKRMKTELLALSNNPRDAFYLPFTMRMLASWKIPELEAVFTSYMDSPSITAESVGLPEQSENYFPPLSFIRRELKFTAIHCLRYFPSEDTIELIINCTNDPDKDIRMAAEKSLRFIEKHSV